MAGHEVKEMFVLAMDTEALAGLVVTPLNAAGEQSTVTNGIPMIVDVNVTSLDFKVYAVPGGVKVIAAEASAAGLASTATPTRVATALTLTKLFIGPRSRLERER